MPPHAKSAKSAEEWNQVGQRARARSGRGNPAEKIRDGWLRHSAPCHDKALFIPFPSKRSGLPDPPAMTMRGGDYSVRARDRSILKIP